MSQQIDFTESTSSTWHVCNALIRENFEPKQFQVCCVISRSKNHFSDDLAPRSSRYILRYARVTIELEEAAMRSKNVAHKTLAN